MTTGRRAVLLIALVLIAVAWCYGLASYPLLDPDEGRNAEIAREMAETNDYIVPRLNGLPYPDKPVLYFAVVATLMEILGPTVLAARLPSLVFAAATVLLVAWFARRRWDSDAAWTAAIATAAAPLTLGFSRTVIFDSTLTFFVTASLIAFYEAIHATNEPGARPAWIWSTAAWGMIGLGLLTKGPIALALPLMVAVPYAFARRQNRVVWEITGVLLCVAIVSPWLRVASRRIPDFIHYALVTETFRRLATTELNRAEPFWYFVPILLTGALPWSVIGLGSIRRSWTTASFLVLWIALPLVFFSFSQSKRPQYLLPLVPAVALLVANAWNGREGRLPGVRAAAVALIILGSGLVFAREMLGPAFRAGAAVTAAVPATATVLGATTLIAGIAAWILAHRRDLVLLALSLPVVAIPFAGLPLLRVIGQERSTASLAQAVQRHVTPETALYAIRTFPPSLPFYLRRTVLLASATGRELTSNYIPRHHSLLRQNPESTLRPEDAWRAAFTDCPRPAIFFASAKDAATREVLATRLALIAETAKTAAYGPCGVSDLGLVLSRPESPPPSPPSPPSSPR